MPKSFDYIIIGGGLAGLQLALKFGNDRFFEQKTFAIIDPSEKDTNDKTWCFWEKGDGQWDHIITQSWDKGLFYSSEKKLELDLPPYRYKMLRSIDFYNYAHNLLRNFPNFSFIKDIVGNIDSASTVVFGKEETYSGLHIFDSRVTQDYENDENSSTLFQHFKGWRIKTRRNAFDPELFTMMDFRLKHANSTSFTYVLPFSQNEALIEFTFFTPYLTGEDIYDENMEFYIKKILEIEDYTIEETEKGVIPMTDFPFYKDSSARVTKIGTGGSWVKGSTGYSFKRTEKKTEQIIQNIKKGVNPSDSLINKDKMFYDSIFIDVLEQNNQLGEQIFSNLYQKNSPQEIFKFLDEETNLKEDIKIMFSLFHPQFLKSLFRKIF